MKKFLTGFLLLLMGQMSQASRLDSLKAAFEKATEADSRAAIAFDIAFMTVANEPSVSVKYLRTSLADSARIKDPIKLGRLGNAYAVALYYLANNDSSLYWARYAVRILGPTGDSVEYYKAYKTQGLALSAQGDHAGAIAIYSKTLNHLKQLKDTTKILGTLNDIGNSFILMKHYDPAIRAQREALHYLRTFPAPATEGNIYNSLGYIHNDLGNLDSAIYYYEISLALKKQGNNLLALLSTQNNLCTCLEEQGYIQKAARCFEELLTIQKRVDDVQGITRSYINLANIYRDKKETQKALSFALKAKTVVDDIDNLELKSSVYKNLAGTYRESGNFKEAYETFLDHIRFKDSVLFSERNKEALEWATKFELGQKELELAEKDKKLITAENEKLLADVAIKKRNLWLFVMSLLIAGGLLIARIWADRNRARQEQSKTRAVLDERDRGLKAIIDAQEEERTRIARELHDGVGNQLLALRMSINAHMPWGDGNPEKEAIEQALQDLMTEVRQVSHQMMPKSLQEFGCVSAIQDMLERTLSHSGIVWSFETHQTDKRYDQRVETALYRVAQELINNVIKHSHATLVSIQLVETANTLILLIEDNGRGISNDADSSEGIGIAGIKSRITAVNGEVNIIPGPQTGTVATIRIPLNIYEKAQTLVG